MLCCQTVLKIISIETKWPILYKLYECIVIVVYVQRLKNINLLVKCQTSDQNKNVIRENRVFD